MRPVPRTPTGDCKLSSSISLCPTRIRVGWTKATGPSAEAELRCQMSATTASTAAAPTPTAAHVSQGLQSNAVPQVPSSTSCPLDVGAAIPGPTELPAAMTSIAAPSVGLACAVCIGTEALGVAVTEVVWLALSVSKGELVGMPEPVALAVWAWVAMEDWLGVMPAVLVGEVVAVAVASAVPAALVVGLVVLVGTAVTLGVELPVDKGVPLGVPAALVVGLVELVGTAVTLGVAVIVEVGIGDAVEVGVAVKVGMEDADEEGVAAALLVGVELGVGQITSWKYWSSDVASTSAPRVSSSARPS